MFTWLHFWGVVISSFCVITQCPQIILERVGFYAWHDYKASRGPSSVTLPSDNAGNVRSTSQSSPLYLAAEYPFKALITAHKISNQHAWQLHEGHLLVHTKRSWQAFIFVIAQLHWFFYFWTITASNMNVLLQRWTAYISSVSACIIVKWLHTPPLLLLLFFYPAQFSLHAFSFPFSDVWLLDHIMWGLF